MILRIFATLVATLSLVPALGAPLALATPSTSHGQISVAQVMEMLEKAAHENTARQVLTAYLAGVGETAVALVDDASETASFACKMQLSLSDRTARKALETLVDKASWAEAPATPLIVRDMVSRAGCTIER